MSSDQATQNEQFKVAIVDSSKNRLQPLIELLESNQLEVNFFSQLAEEADLDFLINHKADIIILNLFVDGQSTLGKIKKIKAKNKFCKIIVLTSHNSINNIRESVKAGADDFIVEPINPSLILDRVKYQLQEREVFNPEELKETPIEEASEKKESSGKELGLQDSFQLVYDSLRVLSEVTNHHEAIVTVLQNIQESAGSNRVNLIEGDLETSKGLVAASSDDAGLEDLEIDLEKYPEVREVLLNSAIIYIKDITQNPLTKDIQDQVKSIKITSMLVVPVRHRGIALGALSIRLSGENGVSEISDRQLKTYFVIALALGPKVAARKLLRKHKFMTSATESIAPTEEESSSGVQAEEVSSSDDEADDLLAALAGEEESSPETSPEDEENSNSGAASDDEADDLLAALAGDGDSTDTTTSDEGEASLEDILAAVEEEAPDSKD